MRSSGFTLIELLVVIAVIGLLSSIVLVSLGPQREKARMAKAESFSAQVASILGAEAVGVWWLDGNALDSSGYDNHGTVTGATPTSDRRLESNRAYSFNGTQKIDIGDPVSAALDFGTDNFTVAAWFKSNGDNQTIVNKKHDNGELPAGYGVWTMGGGIGIFLADGTNWANNGGVYITRGSGVTDNAWHHTVVVFDRTGSNIAKVYIDGSQAGTDISISNVTGSVSNGESFLLGVRKSWAYLTGSLDDVRFFAQAITTAQVEKLYATGSLMHRIAGTERI